MQEAEKCQVEKTKVFVKG